MASQVKRAFLDYSDGQILYRVCGDGDPILLLHMTPRSSDEFREVMPLLAQQNQCAIAMDLMGLGDSDPPPRLYSMADYAKTAIALLDKLGIQQSAILGNLTGAYLAGEIAAAYPDRVSQLILCNLQGFRPEEMEKIAAKYQTGFSLQKDGSHLSARWQARTDYVGAGDLNHRCLLDDLKCFGQPIYSGLAVANYCQSAYQRFQRIQCPTLIVSGEHFLDPLEKAGLTKGRHQKWIKDAIAHSQQIDVAGGTLWMMNQMPDQLSEIVMDFLTHARGMKGLEPC
ncbi:MAG: alpha/beta hydrolase [Symploca sp. SIO2B6]|nr:alpha/beta hydrolase [Symploca sp. SIO2B6]